MTPRQYTDRVAACLQGLSRAEREAIRQEIDGHIEDHICALLDLGYDEQLAEERTMARMGNPEEVGREMRKLYPSAGCWPNGAPWQSARFWRCC